MDGAPSRPSFARISSFVKAMAPVVGARASHPPGVEVAPSFQRVYDECFAMVWRALRRLGVSEAAVADAAQDVFQLGLRHRRQRRARPPAPGALLGAGRAALLRAPRGAARDARRRRGLQRGAPAPRRRPR